MLSAIARHNAKFARRGRLAPEAQAALAAANREVGSLIPETAEPDVPLSDAA